MNAQSAHYLSDDEMQVSPYRTHTVQMFKDYLETGLHCCHVNKAEMHQRRGNKGVISSSPKKLQKSK